MRHLIWFQSPEAAAGGLEMLSQVLLVALLLLLVYILVMRMAKSMRKHETQGLFTEFASERDVRRVNTLEVSIHVPKAASGLELRCVWEGPDGAQEVLWIQEFQPGTHTLHFDLRDKVPGRHSYRLVAKHQVLQRFVVI